jgi:hypothetical protein
MKDHMTTVEIHSPVQHFGRILPGVQEFFFSPNLFFSP